MNKKVKVKSYVRNGNTLYYKLPNEKYLIMGKPRNLEPYLNMVLSNKLKKIEKKYENNYKGQCHYCARDVIQLFKKAGLRCEVIQFQVVGLGRQHVIARCENKYYDFTGKQYDQSRKTFTDDNIPIIYKKVGVAPTRFYEE